MKKYVNTFVRRTLDVLFVALCIVSGLVLYQVLYILFSSLIYNSI